MTVELFPYEWPDGVELLIYWLLPLCEQEEWSLGPARMPDEPLPQVIVTDAAPGTPLDDKVTEHGIYSVHLLADGADRDVAELTVRDMVPKVHRRILALGPPLAPQETVVISGGRLAWAEGVNTSLKFRAEDYGDSKIVRMIGRYAVDTRIRRAV